MLASSPLLEALGNAKTVRNNNSSRFGKWMVLRFNEYGLLHSAGIRSFLLEKTRVVSQALNERNYHIFYQMLRGASAEMLETLALNREASSYALLSSSKCDVVPSIDDKAEFEATVKALVCRWTCHKIFV